MSGASYIGQSPQAAAVVLAEFINPSAPYKSSHASTIAQTSAGTIVAAWFGGTSEGKPDVAIWFARRVNGHWQDAEEVANGIQADGSRYPLWNPVLFQSPGGPLFLFYKVGPSPEKWSGMVITSSDDGRTWSKSRQLPEGILGPIKDKPVVLPNGDWISGSSTEASPSDWRVHFEISNDRGSTWTRTPPVDRGAGFDAIQPTILVLGPKMIEALCRTKQGVIAMTWSSDEGRTWTPLATAELPNPNSGIDAVKLADGRLLLVYNRSAHLPNWSGHCYRYPLDVAISRDGLKWQHVLTLKRQPQQSGNTNPMPITAPLFVGVTIIADNRYRPDIVPPYNRFPARSTVSRSSAPDPLILAGSNGGLHAQIIENALSLIFCNSVRGFCFRSCCAGAAHP